jgi:hypothetical protein
MEVVRQNPAEDQADYGRFAEILLQETILLKGIAGLQEQVKLAVVKREWDDFEALQSVLEEQSRIFQALEAERDLIFGDFSEGVGASAWERFFSFSSRYGKEKQGALLEAYRTLKLESLRLRLASSSLLRYLEEARAVADEFLDAAFPERRGRLYSRRGTVVKSDMRSMIVNRRF